MAYVVSNARKQLITLLKSELNYQLMVISNRMQRTAAESQRLTEQKNQITNAEINKLKEQGVENITQANLSSIALLTTDIDTELTLLSIKDDDMECQMKMIETQLQSLSAEEEEIDKLIDNSAKREFGIFASN